VTWTYSGVPDSCTKDEVRFWAGDTDPNDPLVSDEEIVYTLQAEGGNVKMVAGKILMALSSKFARMVDKTVGGLSLSMSQRAKAYYEQAKELMRVGAAEGCIPYAGAISKSDMQEQLLDSDRVKPSFAKGMDDNPYVPQWDQEGYNQNNGWV
jgi:hypothetical protein